MTEAALQKDEEISLFVLGTMLLRNRGRVVRWMLACAIIAALMVISRPAVYSATTSFAPQGYDAGRSGLAGVAGQFGLSINAGNQSVSPEFYTKLLKSRVLLLPIVHDTFVVREKDGRKISFFELFGIEGGSADSRDERAVKTLSGMVKIMSIKSTGILEVSVATEWRSVSLAIVSNLVQGINDYNQRIRQGQAASERKFVEGRLNIARAELRNAEDRMENFLRSNRDLGSSPELTMQRERIQRDLTLKQEVFTSLTQSYEEVRIREVRDMPVITTVDPPSVRTVPESRGRLKSVLLGLLLGGLIGAAMTLASGMVARRRIKDPEVGEFVDMLGEFASGFLRPVRWLKERVSGRKVTT